MREFPDDTAALCVKCGQWMPDSLLIDHLALVDGHDPTTIWTAEIIDSTNEDES